jgi:hypothetical protein
MRPTTSKLALWALLAAAALCASAAHAHPLPAAPNCPIFPSDSPWNQRVDRAPVSRDSAILIRSIGLNAPVHPTFASGLWQGIPLGIPVSVVSSRTPRVRVQFSRAYLARSDRRAYPLPPRLPVEATPDHHLIVVDRDSCLDYELFDAHPLGNGGWKAQAGVVFNLRSNRLRPPGWMSADAAGLPILPGLVRYDEVARGSINHALRFYAPNTRSAWIYPARHYGSGTNNPSLPPMGIRVRLKANVNISRLPRQARVIAVAMKRYGMILADNGAPWYVSGSPSPHWNNGALHELDQLTGRDFQVVDTSALPHPGL